MKALAFPAGTFFLFTFWYLPLSWAVLGGDKAPSHPFHSRVHTIDVRLGDQSIVCTASSISGNLLLTAGHCFNHLAKIACLSSVGDCEGKFLVNGRRILNFQIFLHPRFQPDSPQDPHYLEKTNYDIAVVRLPKNTFQDFFVIPKKQTGQNAFYQFFGRGMSRIKMVQIEGKKGFVETNRGLLKRIEFRKLAQKNGLIQNQASKVRLGVNWNELLGGQILRSDSGGPLLNQYGEIVGVARNYTLAEKTIEAAAHQMEASVVPQRNAVVEIQSYFTSLYYGEVMSFLQQKVSPSYH